MRQAFGRGLWVGGALSGAMTASGGKFPPGDAATEPDADQELIRTNRARSYPAQDGKLVFDKLSSVFLSGNKTRGRCTEPHSCTDRGSPGTRRALGTNVPGAGLRAGRGWSGGHGFELRAVWCDHGEGRPPHPRRRWLGARIHPHLTTRAGLNVSSSSDQTRNLEPRPAETCRVKNPSLPVTLTGPTASQLPPPQRWSK